jgi:hypothetical protein
MFRIPRYSASLFSTGGVNSTVKAVAARLDILTLFLGEEEES